MYGGMRIGYLKNAEVIFSQILALFIVNAVTYGQLSLLIRHLFPLEKYACMMGLQIVFIIVWTLFASFLYKNMFPPRKLLLVHGDRPIEDILAKFEKRKDKFDVCKCMHINSGVKEIEKKRWKGMTAWYCGIFPWRRGILS